MSVSRSTVGDAWALQIERITAQASDSQAIWREHALWQSCDRQHGIAPARRGPSTEGQTLGDLVETETLSGSVLFHLFLRDFWEIQLSLKEVFKGTVEFWNNYFTGVTGNGPKDHLLLLAPEKKQTVPERLKGFICPVFAIHVFGRRRGEEFKMIYLIILSLEHEEDIIVLQFRVECSFYCLWTKKWKGF